MQCASECGRRRRGGEGGIGEASGGSAWTGWRDEGKGCCPQFYHLLTSFIQRSVTCRYKHNYNSIVLPDWTPILFLHVSCGWYSTPRTCRTTLACARAHMAQRTLSDPHRICTRSISQLLAQQINRRTLRIKRIRSILQRQCSFYDSHKTPHPPLGVNLVAHNHLCRSDDGWACLVPWRMTVAPLSIIVTIGTHQSP